MAWNLTKPQAVKFGSGVLELLHPTSAQYVNLGLVEDVTLTIEKTVFQKVADNGETAPRSKVSAASLSATLSQVALDNIHLMEDVGQYSVTDGSAVNFTDETVTGASFVKWVPFVIQFKNGDGSAVTLTAVKIDAVTQTQGTDYEVYASGTQTFITPLKTLAGTVTITGSYTPNVGKQIIYNDDLRDIPQLEYRFTNTSNGKPFTITFPSAYNSENFAGTFQSNETGDESLTVPINIVGQLDANNQRLILSDDQDTSASTV